MRFKKIAILLAFLFTGCYQGAYDPFSFAPKSFNTIWQKQTSSILITSTSCYGSSAKSPLPDQLKNKELTLAELIDITLQNNPTTKQTWADALARAAQYGQSLSNYFPTINAETTYTRERVSTFVPGKTPGDAHFFLTKITPETQITYTIYDFGQTYYFSETARQALFFADFTHNRQLQNAVQNVMNAYYDYQFQLQSLSALEADLETTKTTLDAANEKFQTGVSAVSDVTQATTSYLQTKINLLSQKTALETSFANLATIAGLPAHIPFSTQKMPEDLSTNVPIPSIDSLIEMAKKNRQDLFAAEADVASKKANVSYAKSEEYPTFSGEFDYGRNIHPGYTPEAYHFTGLLTFSVPLFKGFYYTNAIRNAKALLERSKATLEETELTISKDVAIARETLQNAKDTLDCALEYLASANERFKIVLSQYKVGTTTILDVIASQSSLADARAKKASAQRDWLSAIVGIAYSTGSLCINPQSQERL